MGGSARDGGGLLSISPLAAAPPAASAPSDQPMDSAEATRVDQLCTEGVENGTVALENGTRENRNGNPTARDNEADEKSRKLLEASESGSQPGLLGSTTDPVDRGNGGGVAADAGVGKLEESLNDRTVEPTGSDVVVASGGGEDDGSAVDAAEKTPEATAPTAVTAGGLVESEHDSAIARGEGVGRRSSEGIRAGSDEVPAIARAAVSDGSPKAASEGRRNGAIAPRRGDDGASHGDDRVNGGHLAAAKGREEGAAPAREREGQTGGEDANRVDAVGDESEGKLIRQQNGAAVPGSPHGHVQTPRGEKQGCACAVM